MNAPMLLDLMLTQFAQIAVLATLAWVLTRKFADDRPHLAHAMWILVLLKCISPPIIASPISPFSVWAPADFFDSVPEPSNELVYAGREPTPIATEVILLANAANISSGVAGGSVSPSAHPQEFAAEPWGNLLHCALGIWVLSSLGVLTCTALRLVFFLRRIKRLTVPSSEPLVSVAHELTKRLGIGRQIQVRIVDAPIGPAVVGLIRPTILLPKSLVKDCSTAALEPLIAHELIHIRRGDLGWALLQSVSLSLWWFHPLVHIATRLVTREAERCCDEETVLSLDLAPREYAKCLLDVLERKHLMRTAPSLPGVRPVDITSKRLERIMRLGHGSHRRTPAWFAPLLVLGAVIVLPGAAWIGGQDGQEEAPLLSATNTTEVQTQAEVQAYEFPVADLISRAQNELGIDEEAANEAILRQLPIASQVSAEIRDGVLRLSCSPAVAKRLRQSLADIRKYGLRQIDIQVKIVEMPAEAFEQASAMALAASKVTESSLEDSKVFSDLGIEGRVIRMSNLSAFLERRNDVRVLSSPSIRTHSGRTATLQIGEEKIFVSDLEPVGEGSSKKMQPVVTSVVAGLRMELTPILHDSDEIEAPASKQTLQLNASLRLDNIADVETRKVIDADQGELTLEKPSLVSNTVEMGFASVELGQEVSLVLRHPNYRQSENANNPSEKIATIALIRCQLATRKNAGGEATATTPARANPSAKTRQPEKPVAVLGPLTSGGPAMALDPPSDAEVLRALAKILPERVGLPTAITQRRSNWTIVKEKIADYVDPPRFIPYIGLATLHHAHYKCTVYSSATGSNGEKSTGIAEERCDVVYVDHNHFHIPDAAKDPTQE